MLDQNEQLPRLLTDPTTGEIVLEFSQTRGDGRHVSILERSVIKGVFTGKVSQDDGCVFQDINGKGVLRVVNGFYHTDHDYQELRDLLWPIEKTEVF